MAPRRNKTAERKIASERIERLFESAEKMQAVDPSLSRRYILLSRKIAMKYRIKIPKKYRLAYCRKCFSLYSSGNNARTRINRGKVSVTCLNCGNIRRYPIKDKK